MALVYTVIQVSWFVDGGVWAIRINRLILDSDTGIVDKKVRVFSDEVRDRFMFKLMR